MRRRTYLFPCQPVLQESSAFSRPLENSQVSGTIAAVEYDKVTPKGATGDAVRSPVIVNCWTQNGDYSMTLATQCFQHRLRSAIHRSDRLPTRPAFHARDCSHRGSL